MKRSATFKALGVLAAVALVQIPHSAQACAMCMGAPDNHTGEALNGAIFLMLGCIGAMMLGIGAVAYSFVRRARNLAARSETNESFHPEGTESLS
jgi:hypothetical protein